MLELFDETILYDELWSGWFMLIVFPYRFYKPGMLLYWGYFMMCC